MNEVLRAIANRRSIRQYRQEQIKDAELRAILEAGLQAPSAHNDQSTYLVAIQDRELIKEISDGSKLEMQKSDIEWVANAGRNEAYNIFYDAPTAVIVAAKKEAVAPLADVCAAVENMLVAAESLRIGSCWIGFARFYFAKPESYKKIGIPDGYEVFFAVTLGYKAKGLKLNPRQKKYEDFYRIKK